eukprot:TRINITY_DN477_c0_g1_i6.p1 TRINITY_DN477_c0_g1~~TRINITY_DN477_c0_g1_i6.p1  ORF type:complete len:547 (+),score=118.82 TRINITY_DN477_c0_g1_i6:282-1922(+)
MAVAVLQPSLEGLHVPLSPSSSFSVRGWRGIALKSAAGVLPLISASHTLAAGGQQRAALMAIPSPLGSCGAGGRQGQGVCGREGRPLLEFAACNPWPRLSGSRSRRGVGALDPAAEGQQQQVAGGEALESENGAPFVLLSPEPSHSLAEQLQARPLMEEAPPCPASAHTSRTVSITVVGASGDLARKKIFPALFALYYEGCLPKHFSIFGYARSPMSDEELRTLISTTLTCRIDQRENCGDKMESFLKRCFYQAGQYDSADGFGQLDKKLKKQEDGRVACRLFYLSIPPNVFMDVARSVSRAASAPAPGVTRGIVEKPFGRDTDSSAQLTEGLSRYLREDQIYRIDHYLGKELVENLSVLRFSNLVFEPLWSRQYIRNVQLLFSEDFGTEGRGGYFDNYGIIRDIMQNHLLQIMALFAMEPPVSLNAEDVINEKVKVLRSTRVLALEDVVVGQYKAHTSKGGCHFPAYTDDPTVPPRSITPTFAAVALHIDNGRWDGVPFLMKAGKALHTKRDPSSVPPCAGQHLPPAPGRQSGPGHQRAGHPPAA